MRKIIVSIFLLLALICSCSERSETAADSFKKAEALKYTDLKKTIDYFNNAIKLKKDDACAYNNRGIAYAKLGQSKLAIEDFNEAIRLKPDFADAYVNRGVIYTNLRQYQLAIDDHNKAIQLNPDNANAYKNRGIAYLSKGSKNLGCRDAKKACELGNCRILEIAKDKRDCR